MASTKLQIIITAVDRASKQLKATGLSFEQLGQKSFKAGALITGASIAVGGAALKAAADYDTLARATNQMLKLNDSAFKSMKKDVRELAIQVGKSANEMQEAMYVVGSAGFRGAESMEVLTVVGEAATAGMANAADVAGALSKAMNVFGYSGNQARETMDKLFRIVDAGLLTFEELAQSFPRAAVQAASLGVSFDEVGASLATLTKTAGSTEEAATAINATFTALNKPSEKLGEWLRSLGYDSGQMAIKAIGLTGVLEKLREQYGDNTAALADMFPNVRALQALFPLVGTAVEDYNTALMTAGDDTITVGGYFQDMAEGPGFQMKQAMEELRDIMIELGDKIVPYVKDVTEMIKVHKDLIAEIVTTKAKYVLMVGAFLLFIGIVAKTITAVSTIMGALAALGGAIGLTTTATGLLGTALLAIPTLVAITVVAYGLYKVIDGFIQLKKRIDEVHKAEEETIDMRSRGFERYKGMMESENEDVRRYAQLKMDSLQNQFDAIDGLAERQSQAHRDQISQFEDELVMRGLLVRQGGQLVELTGYSTDAMMSYASAADFAGSSVNNLGSIGMEAFDGITEATKDAGGAAKDTAEEYEKILEKIKDLQAEEQKLKVAYAKKTLDFKTRYAEAYVKQEELVASQLEDLEGKKAELKKEMTKSGYTEDLIGHKDRINNLRNEVQEAEDAYNLNLHLLESKKNIETAYENEVAEVRRVNALTDFQRTLENLGKEQMKYNRAYLDELDRIQDEMDKEQEKADLIIDMNNKTTDIKIINSGLVRDAVIADDDLIAENKKRRAKEIEQANAILYGGSTSAYYTAAPMMSVPFAKGGIVTSPTNALIGEAGPEAVIPLNKMGGLGNIVLNITGTFLSETAAIEVGDMIIDRLKENVRV